jgi:hypothetical protein
MEVSPEGLEAALIDIERDTVPKASIVVRARNGMAVSDAEISVQDQEFISKTGFLGMAFNNS